MCDFCKARKEEIERGFDVTCKIFAIDYKKMEKYEYLMFDLKYCPNCGKSFANGDSEKAITLKTEKEDFISMVEMSEKIKQLEKQIYSMYTYEQVQYVKRGACIDGKKGYEPSDLLIEYYI